MNGEWIWGVIVLLAVAFVFGAFFKAAGQTKVWYKERYGDDWRKQFRQDGREGLKNFFKNLTWKSFLPFYTKDELHRDEE